MKYLSILMLLLALNFGTAYSQDDWFSIPDEEITETESEFHHHHLGLFMGASSQLNNGEVAFATGLDYTYFFPNVYPIIGVGAFVEGAFSKRSELIFGSAFTLQPWDEVKFVAAPSVIYQNLDSLEIDEIHKTSQVRFLMRFGGSYSFHFDNVSVAPTIYADVVGSRVSLVYGITFGYAFKP